MSRPRLADLPFLAATLAMALALLLPWALAEAAPEHRSAVVRLAGATPEGVTPH